MPTTAATIEAIAAITPIIVLIINLRLTRFLFASFSKISI